MRIRVLKTLRGATLIADPGDEIELPFVVASGLVAAGAAENMPVIERADEAPAERAVEQPAERPKSRRPSRKRKPKKVSGE